MNLTKSFSDYYKNVRPSSASNESAVRVDTAIFLKQLLSVDESDQTINCYIWMEHVGCFSSFKIVAQYFTDPDLSWHPDHYSGVKTLNVPVQDIWVPDLIVYNT